MFYEVLTVACGVEAYMHALAEISFGDLLEFLNYGAAGVLALAFIAMLILFWKKDKQTTEAMDMLKERDMVIGDENDRLEKMIEVVRQNTEAMTSVRMAVEQNTQVIQRLDLDFSKRLDDMSRDIREMRNR